MSSGEGVTFKVPPAYDRNGHMKMDRVGDTLISSAMKWDHQGINAGARECLFLAKFEFLPYETKNKPTLISNRNSGPKLVLV